MDKRAAIYVRVSTDRQTIENQLRELRQIAERRGWEVVHEYHDTGISGTKSREARPGLDEMLKDAQRRRFDIVMAWAIDRLGRSLIDLLGTIQTLGMRCRSLPRSAINRYDDARRAADVSTSRRVCRIRAQHNPPTGACRA